MDKPISTGGEENILCRPSDRYYGGGRGEDIFLHEFAHAIHNLGVTGAIPNFDGRIRALYNKRKYGRDQRWKNTYYMSTGKVKLNFNLFNEKSIATARKNMPKLQKFGIVTIFG